MEASSSRRGGWRAGVCLQPQLRDAGLWLGQTRHWSAGLSSSDRYADSCHGLRDSGVTGPRMTAAYAAVSAVAIGCALLLHRVW